jgi:hypothetical protein
MLVYDYGSKKNEKMKETWNLKGKSWEIVTQPKIAVWGSLLSSFEQHLPLIW